VINQADEVAEKSEVPLSRTAIHPLRTELRFRYHPAHQNEALTPDHMKVRNSFCGKILQMIQDLKLRDFSDELRIGWNDDKPVPCFLLLTVKRLQILNEEEIMTGNSKPISLSQKVSVSVSREPFKDRPQKKSTGHIGQFGVCSSVYCINTGKRVRDFTPNDLIGVK
jgi:hypothetical protein